MSKSKVQKQRKISERFNTNIFNQKHVLLRIIKYCILKRNSYDILYLKENLDDIINDLFKVGYEYDLNDVDVEKLFSERSKSVKFCIDRYDVMAYKILKTTINKIKKILGVSEYTYNLKNNEMMKDIRWGIDLMNKIRIRK
jgi:hypothetical protein